MLSRVLIAILRLWSSGRTRGELQHDAIQSLLIVELSRLGDVVAMLRSLGTLARSFPRARIHLLIDGRYAPLIESLQLDVVVHLIHKSDSVIGLTHAILASRKINSDLAISISPSKRNAISTLASQSRSKVGYLSHINSLTPFLVRPPIESFGCMLASEEVYGMQNIADRASKICRSLGIGDTTTGQSIEIRSSVFETTTSRLKERGVLPESPFVVIHPFSGWSYRNWDIQRFEHLADRIIKSTSFSVVFVCAREEEDMMHKLSEKLRGNRRVSLFSSSSIPETAVVIQHASVFIGNDSGPLHLASALGLTVVGLFGPASPELTAPPHLKGATLYKKVECSPCDQRKCVRPEAPCMSLLSVDEVMSQVVKCLAHENSRSATAHA